MKTKPLPCPFCGAPPKFSFFKKGSGLPEIPGSWWSLACNSKTCGGNPQSFGDKKADALFKWNYRVAPDLVQSSIENASEPPFVARCGNLLFLVESMPVNEGNLIMLRGKILEGHHFNDAGDFGRGDEVTIGPIIHHWRRISTF